MQVVHTASLNLLGNEGGASCAQALAWLKEANALHIPTLYLWGNSVTTRKLFRTLSTILKCFTPFDNPIAIHLPANSNHQGVGEKKVLPGEAGGRGMGGAPFQNPQDSNVGGTNKAWQ